MTRFTFCSGIPQKFVSVFAFAFLIGATSLALAVKPDPSEPGAHLLIKEVEVTVDAVAALTTFTIQGQDFNFTNLSDLSVTLGELGALTIQTATANTIEATYPAAIASGEYLLSVSTGNGQSKHDEFDLTIGAVGPQGPQGPQGPGGPQGPQGPQGPSGEGAQSLLPQGVREIITVPPKDENGDGIAVRVLTCPPGFFVMSPGYLYDSRLILHVFDLHADLSSRSIRIGVRNPNDRAWDVQVDAYCYRLQ